jgi:predicted nucleic acid-binding protein
MLVLDTDVLRTLRKQKKHAAAQAWLLSVPQSQLYTTVISIAEIKCAIERQRPSHPDYAAGTQVWLDGFLAAGAGQILSLSIKAAIILAQMHETAALRNFIIADPRQTSRKSPADLAIAAIAIAESATVATGNQAPFEEIHALFPLQGLFNSFTGVWVVTAG